MAEKVYKKICVTGCSSQSYERAIELAVRKASESLRSLAWFEVKEMRGGIGSDRTLEFQITLEVAFEVD